MFNDQVILDAAKNLIINCLGAKKNEKILIVTDNGKINIAYNFAKAGRELGIETVLIESEAQLKGEPSVIVSEAMLNADVIFAITSMSYSHTKARGAANEKGARVASMPMMSVEIAKEYLNADYINIKIINKKLLKIFEGAKTIRVTTKLGTDLIMDISGRQLLDDNGDLTASGCIGNLPAGEVYIAPIENKANGTLVIDGVIAYLGKVSEPVKLTIKDGNIIKIEGEKSANDLEEFLKDKDEEAWGIAEFGIGTNEKAKLIGNPLVDEKVWGTIHIAFGTNKFMGGERISNIHYDCIINEPTVYVDDKMIIKDGEHIY